jgi:ParB-like chromosome segregation protein Spo0J
MTLIPIDQLRLPNDETAIPRLREEAYLISRYVAAMRLYDGWGEFPEVTVDQENLVLDGVHRVEAALRTDIVQVPANVVECETDAERLLLAAELNATHGAPWSSKDITKVAILAERFGVEASDLASVMRVKVERIERVPITTVIRKTTNREEKVYAKKAVRGALRGRVLTETEEEVMLQLTTPNKADTLLLDLIRLDALDALPQLDHDSRRNVVRVQSLLQTWLERDEHLFDAD